MKVKDIIGVIKEDKNQKSDAIIKLCNSFLPLEDMINFDQNNVIFARPDKNASIEQTVTDLFLSKLAILEFGINGWTFAGGTHKAITETTILEAEKFGYEYGMRFGKDIPLATGATSSFMEIINRGYNKSNNYAITSTTRFPVVNDKVNKEIRYCFTATTFNAMELFLIHNAIAGVFFEGGIGTSFEAFSMLIERQRNEDINMPLIFIQRNQEHNILFDILKSMQDHGKLYDTDVEHIYSVSTAQEAVQILEQYEIFKKAKNNSEAKEYQFIRDIFEVSKERYL